MPSGESIIYDNPLLWCPFCLLGVVIYYQEGWEIWARSDKTTQPQGGFMAMGGQMPIEIQYHSLC